MLTSIRELYRALGCRGCSIRSAWIPAMVMFLWFGAVGLLVHQVAAEAWSPVPETGSAATIRTSTAIATTGTSHREIERPDDELPAALLSVSIAACIVNEQGRPTGGRKNQGDAPSPAIIDQARVNKWLTPANDGLAAIPPAIEQLKPIAKDQLPSVHEQLWQAYRKSPKGEWLSKLLPDPVVLQEDDNPTAQPHELKVGDKRMPFYFIAKGDLPEERPLFIALHGGGSAGGRAPSPHGWAVNTREWHAQARLAAGVYPSKALYFVPRMADDNDGRWYFDYCQDAYDRIVRAAILHRHVNPNRVYLIGISEGAYTAYRIGAFMADRWAGAGSMAGGEPLQNAPPENMRNVAFRADIGQHDTMFDRVGLNRRYGQALARLKQDDPGGFRYRIEVQAGRGHGIDYRPCPRWLVQYQRSPWPRRVTWTVIKVHGRRKQQLYWLAMDRDPPVWPVYVDARVDRKTNRVTVTIEKDDTDGGRTATDAVALRVYLNDDLLDLDRAVTVVRNGAQVFNGKVQRKVATMVRSLAERGDPYYVFPAVLTIP